MNTHIGTGKKHLFFDMDDTVTLTRSRMDDDVYELFSKLPHDIIIVSGAHIDTPLNYFENILSNTSGVRRIRT